MKIRLVPKRNFVPIVGDGAIAIGTIGEGRVIPVVIVDCRHHPELLNLIYLHENAPPGDVRCTWTVKSLSKTHVFLELDFSRPAVVSVGLMFDLDRQFVLADGIVQARGMYIQPSKSGLRVSEGIDQPKILIEVPPGTQLPNWNRLILDRLYRKFKKGGTSRRLANEAAKSSLAQSRTIWGLRATPDRKAE
jgi:hypothetical protein